MAVYDTKYKFWVATKEQLDNVMIKQRLLQRAEPVKERFTAHCVFADLYCDYLDLVNKLGYIYHRTFQVQKRELLTRLLEAAGTRLIELRNDLKDVELSEFVYIDRTLMQRKKTYDMVQIVRPDFFPYIRNREIYDLLRQRCRKKVVILTEEEEKKLQLDIKRGIVKEKQKSPDDDLTEDEINLQNAVLLIQNHERLRINRIWKTNIKYNPKAFLPNPDSYLKQKYKFTFKPDQEMLIPLRKTKFDDNYFKGDTLEGKFEFYAKTIIDHSKRQSEVVAPPKKKSLKKSIQINSSENVEFILHDNDENVEIQHSKSFILRDRSSDNTNKMSNADKFDKAARKIQSAWTICLARRAYYKKLQERSIIYGKASERKVIRCPLDELYQRSYELKTIKDQYAIDFLKAIDDERTRIVVKRSEWLMEDISDHIRFWIENFYRITDELPPFPAEAKGGTVLVLRERVLTAQQFIQNKNKTPEKLAAEAKKLKEDRKKQKAKARRNAKWLAEKERTFMAKIAKEGKVFYDFDKLFNRNKTVKAMKTAYGEVNGKWYYDVNEKTNTKEAPFLIWISEDKFAEIHIELRRVVDKLMRLEYEVLKRALCIDRKKKYRPPKPQKERRKRKGKGKGKHKKEIDLTADLSIEEIYFQMVDTGLIRKYKKRCFEEFVGDLNYCAYELKNYFQLDVLPSTYEVRNILTEWILGMGPLKLPKYKGILIAGPPKSAKVQLCEILASEIDAVMIDLSIEVVVKYKDDMPLLIHLIKKMSKILQPTILFIENVHRTFWKKVPAKFKDLSPLLLSTYMKGILKSIKPEDNIFVLGTTDEPWTGKGKMKASFEKIILMPKTDYSSAFMFWRNFILQNKGVDRDLEFSPLAWVCKNYTSGQIAENISKTLDIERKMKLLRKKLKFEEFIETFIDMKTFPAYPDAYAKYYKWFKRANKIERKRTQVMKILNAKARKK